MFNQTCSILKNCQLVSNPSYGTSHK